MGGHYDLYTTTGALAEELPKPIERGSMKVGFGLFNQKRSSRGAQDPLGEDRQERPDTRAGQDDVKTVAICHSGHAPHRGPFRWGPDGSEAQIQPHSRLEE